MIETTIKNLTLNSLVLDDSEELFRLIQNNKTHLTSHGDYSDLVLQDKNDLEASIDKTNEKEIFFVLKMQSKIIGALTLTRHAQEIYGIGYWIDQNYLGKGYMSSALASLINWCVKKQQAKEIWAGITHSNRASVKLVEKLGFKLARKQATYNSYLLSIHNH